MLPSSLQNPKQGSVCFCAKPSIEVFHKLEDAQIALLFTAPFDFVWSGSYELRVSNTPKHAFCAFLPPPKYFATAHPTAVVHPDAQVHVLVHIGAFCYVGPGCTIGPGTILHPRVTLLNEVIIGANCELHSGVVVGADGFGYVRALDDALTKFEHFGNVVIEDDVEIGPNTNINRGTLDTTLIREGTKIDALCHIGHNAQIGPHATIAAGTIMGRSDLGQAVYTGLNSTILPGNNIEAHGTVGAHAVVTRSVGEGTTVVGSPAKPIVRVRKPGGMW